MVLNKKENSGKKFSFQKKFMLLVQICGGMNAVN